MSTRWRRFHSWWSSLFGALLVLVLATSACRRGPQPAPTLAQLRAEDDVEEAGRHLMAVAPGLHRLDDHQPAPRHVVVGVHGYASEGYEWVYPLTTLGEPTGDDAVQIHFHRWDWEQCPEPAAAELERALDTLMSAEPPPERVQIIGHSYGGVISAMVATRYDGTIPLEVDLVASPLAGLDQDRCVYTGARPPPAGAPVTLRQWRTRQDLDGAFRDLPRDPQEVELPGEVTRLPESYRGHRLGHNWSISWVADRLRGIEPPP